MNTINSKNIKSIFDNKNNEKGVRNKRRYKSDHRQRGSKKIQGLLRQECKNVFKTDRDINYKFFEEPKMIEINETNVSDFFTALGFKLKDGEENTYIKFFSKFRGFQIEARINKDNFRNSKIVYGEDIRKDRETSCNFSQQENFVILECVNRLLEKGYSPKNIYLEKYYQTGRSGSGGFLDIQILGEKNNQSFLMIECKTFGKEFDKEESKMYEDGGQLFSYFNQDRNTEYLCLYSSYLENYEINYKNNIIKVTEQIKKSTNHQEAYENWKPQIFEKRGVFGDDIKPYLIEFSGLTKKDLRPLTKMDVSTTSKEDKRDIFNRFAEILRRNVISDKTNAYNKIFNLFLCKIVDECERKTDEKLKFQWEENESNEEVLLRLNELYKSGMENYLKLKISAVDIKDFEEKLRKIKNERDKKEIEEMFIRQKLYTSNDFAFREVFDKNTFDLNSDVVKEVVKLLEEFQIKYKTKQQFLGDFFEKLLNTGIKQEQGQFFTPVPIAQFVCKSLPIKEIIDEKNKNGEINILPYVMDYASGAGHFLTECMEEIDNYITEIDEDYFKNQQAKKEFNKYKEDFGWAEEYIYGIEKDYRLAKTTKVATYLNGDGDAQIILGDGLDNFYKSRDYKRILKLNEDIPDLERFDIVVANPPYAVSGFKTTLKFGKESFDLFNKFTSKSKEIECLFVERTKQLLKEGGVAGIVLPLSILTNGSIYTLTRSLILENFEIKGIVELGSNTFMATGINTIILFVKKINNKKDDIIYFINKSIDEKKDNSIEDISKPITKFLENSYQIDFKTYIDFFYNEDINNKVLNKLLIYKEYVQQFKKQKKIRDLKEFIKIKEIDKILTFILTYNKKVIISNIPSNNKEEKEFLGYEFSNRRGYEGINIFQLGGALYNPLDNLDDTKINYYILKNFLGEEIEEINPEATTIKILPLHECIDFRYSNFEKTINLNKEEEIKSKCKKESLKDIFPEIKNGVDVFQEDNPKKYRVSRIETIANRKINLKKTKWTNDEVKDEEFLKEGDILMSHINSMEHIGKTAFFSNIEEKVIHGVNTLRFRTDRKDIKKKYLYLFFQYPHLIRLLRSYAKKAVHQASIRISDIQRIEIPVPDEGIQNKIIDESEILEKTENELEKKNEIIYKKISDKLKSGDKKQIKNILNDDGLISGKRPVGGVAHYNEGVISLGGEHIGNDGKITLKNVKYVPEEFYEDHKDFEIKPLDILMCKDGALTGKVALVRQEDLKQKMIINEHIFIIRTGNIELQKYLFYYFYFNSEEIEEKAKKKAQSGLGRDDLMDLELFLDVSNLDKIDKEISLLDLELLQNQKSIKEIENKKCKIIEKYLIED